MAAKRKSPTKPMEAVEAQVNQLLNAVESFYQAAHNGDYKKMRKARDARNVLALSLQKISYAGMELKRRQSGEGI